MRSLVLAALMGAASAQASALEYKAIDLGAFTAAGINNFGQIAGNAVDGQIVLTGLNGVGYRELGTFGAPTAYVAGLNDLGQIVGTLNAANGPGKAFATGFEGYGLAFLGPEYSQAAAINDLGQVVGTDRTGAFATGPFGVGIHRLDVPPSGQSFPTSSFALAINDLGQVAGGY